MEFDEGGLEKLCNQIILLACKDYRAARKKLAKHPENKSAKAKIREIESFFGSAWYTYLTSVPGDVILRRLREEVVE